jgi:hypothetical protein
MWAKFEFRNQLVEKRVAQLVRDSESPSVNGMTASQNDSEAVSVVCAKWLNCSVPIHAAFMLDAKHIPSLEEYVWVENGIVLLDRFAQL